MEVVYKLQQTIHDIYRDSTTSQPDNAQTTNFNVMSTLAKTNLNQSPL